MQDMVNSSVEEPAGLANFSLASDGPSDFGAQNNKVPSNPIPPTPNEEKTPTPNQEDSTTPTHRSHDPTNNLKRSNPFQFGSRYLLPEDDAFEFNAWDHVTPDATYNDYAESQYAFHRDHPVSEFDKSRFYISPEKWWDKFYGNNATNFFQDRKWLRQEFPILDEVTKKEATQHQHGEGCNSNSSGGSDVKGTTILEIGCGAGNTCFPILRNNENPSLRIHAVDYSKKAIDLIKSHPEYNPNHLQADVWDISDPINPLPPNLKPSSVDIVLLVFIFSALSPQQWDQAIRNIWQVLKPGGEVCFRDYGRGDLTQVRFKKGRLLEEGFYIRGDGTRVYFFEEEELRRIWEGGGVSSHGRNEVRGVDCDKDDQTGHLHVDRHHETNSADENASSNRPRFDILSLGVDRRMLVNRQKKLKMYRCWMQGRFRKPIANEAK